MGTLSSLNREQKEAIGLLQIGTFLEYFDLMLYVHMAILLNELFFPKTDPHTASLIAAFAFCSTFVLRPFGALIFGYIGDHIGRKSTVIITTLMMSISCVIMANLPTYAQIGISATWIITICRMVQGLSSMGEVMGAEIYITEITKPPIQYPATSLPSVAASVGGMAALGVAALVTTYEGNWRIAFWIGAGIAVVGSIARTRLRETPEFIEGKRKSQKEIEERYKNEKKKECELGKFERKFKEQTVNKKNLITYFFIGCGWPLCFYLAYMYFNPLLKETYGYSGEDIIFHNFFLSITSIFFYTFLVFISYKIHPLKILKFKFYFFAIITILLPFLISMATSPLHIFLIQMTILTAPLGGTPAPCIFIKHFPTLKRFTATSFIYALTRASMYTITSFGLVYLTDLFSHYGLWIIMIPVNIGFLWGVNHYIKLEQESGDFYKQDKINPLISQEISS